MLKRLGLAAAALLLGAWTHGVAPAPPAASVPITSVVMGTYSQPVQNQIRADTLHNCISTDNTTYVTADDTNGFGNSGSANMMIGKFTSEAPWTGANVNFLSNFGSFSTNYDGNRSPKLSGIFCDGGIIYGGWAGQCRTNTGGCNYTGNSVYSQQYGSLIKSADHGATWAGFQNPTSYNASGSIPSPSTSGMWTGSTGANASTFATPAFVMYGADGTLYYGDNADTYVYLISSDGNWDNGNAVYLARVLKNKLPNLNGADYTFWNGGTDGTQDASWSPNFSSAQPILSNPGKIGFPSMQYIPSINRYLMFEWYYPSAPTTNTTHWMIYEAPHPWGPWTQVGTDMVWSPQGFYNPSVAVRSAMTAQPNSDTAPLTLMFAGDYGTYGTGCSGAGGYYCLFTASLRFNTSAPAPSASANTINATWTTAAAENTSMACGTTVGTYNIQAVDNGSQTNVTSHSAIVAGLTPSTTYYCQTGATAQTFSIATNALAATTPIVSITVGTIAEPTPNQIQGDVFSNVISNDNITYVTSDDTNTFGNGGSSNLIIGKFTTEAPAWSGVNVNTLPNFGTLAQGIGDDNKSQKWIGLASYKGVLYGTSERQVPVTGQTAVASGSILKSSDHGVTWCNYQGACNTSGPITSPASAGMFGTGSLMASSDWVKYGPDDGTLGYRVDNAEAYAYLWGNDQNWSGGDDIFLARVPIWKLPNLNAADYQWYTGGSGGDGTLPSSWSSSSSAKTSVLHDPGKLAWGSLVYYPQFNRYVLMTDYYPVVTTTNDTFWRVWEAPHPWGPWTLIYTHEWTPQGYYMPKPMMRTVPGATANGTPVTVNLGGDYGTCCNSGGYYHLWTTPVTLNTH